MALSSIVKIAIGSLAVADAIALQNVKPHESPELSNDATKPRMLVMRGCDGSKTIEALAHDLLHLHGLDAQMDHEMLSPDKNSFYEQGEGSLRKALELANEDAQAKNRTMVFKAKTHNFRAVWPRVKEAMKPMGTLAVIGYRKNMLDEVVCQVRNCINDKNGYPVDKHGIKKSQEQCDEHRPKRHVEPYRAHLDTARLLEAINDENDLVEDARRTLRMSGFPYSELQTEKLLGFTTTNSQDDLDIAKREWSIFLRGWGVHPDEAMIENRLKVDQHTQAPAMAHEDIIVNFGEVKQTLRAAKAEYTHLLLDCEAPSACAAAAAAATTEAPAETTEA